MRNSRKAEVAARRIRIIQTAIAHPDANSRSKSTSTGPEKKGNSRKQPRGLDRKQRLAETAARPRRRPRTVATACTSADQAAYAAASKAPGFKYHSYHGWLFGRAWKGYNPSTHEVTW